jgi:hypothetical protein
VNLEGVPDDVDDPVVGNASARIQTGLGSRSIRSELSAISTIKTAREGCALM